MTINLADDVLELCCFEWFQNSRHSRTTRPRGFRAVLFRMVPKLGLIISLAPVCFRAVLFRMVPKRIQLAVSLLTRFRAVLFRMVPKPSKFKK